MLNKPSAITSFLFVKVKSANASIDPYLQVLEAGIAKMLGPGSLYTGERVRDAPFLAANVLICSNEPGTVEFLERVMLNAAVYQHKMGAVKGLIALGKSDVVKRSLADGKQGNTTTNVRSLFSGRDPVPFACPMMLPNG